MHTFAGFIHFCTCGYLMTELGLKVEYSMLLFLHIKIENQPLTDRTHHRMYWHTTTSYSIMHNMLFTNITTAEINTFRNLVIVSIFLSWVFRPHWPFLTSVKISQDALKTRISLSSPVGIQEHDYNTAISWFTNIILRYDGKQCEKIISSKMQLK